MLQETAQRERLLSTLQEDRERLQASHATQLEKLRLQLETQMQKTQLTHSRKVTLIRYTLSHTFTDDVVLNIWCILHYHSKPIQNIGLKHYFAHQIFSCLLGVRAAGTGRSD